MGNINYQFLEAYKLLDKICREMYQGEKGVTAYIDDMKCVPVYESRAIPGWHSDLQQLIALRHLRNRMTHECGTLDQEMCTQSEIIWLNKFYSRILQRTDPIALLEKSRRRERLEKGSTEERTILSSDVKMQDSGRNGKSKPRAVSVFLAILLYVALVLLLFKLSMIQ